MARLLALLCMLSAIAVAPARADTGAFVFVSRAQYVPGDDDNLAPLVMPQGRELEFHNLDVLSFGSHHSITSDSDGLFDSGVIHARASVTLDLSALTAGTYGFHCSVHSDVMHGTLVIV